MTSLSWDREPMLEREIPRVIMKLRWQIQWEVRNLMVVT